MNLALYLLFFAIGLALIIKGSDWFVDATIWVARTLSIPEFIIGATLVSICTTLPELLVSTGAALNNDTSMALGNAVGSVACNTGLILGMVIFFSPPPMHHRKALRLKSIFISACLVVYIIISMAFGEISRMFGIIFILLSFSFVFYNYYEARKYKESLVVIPVSDKSRKTVIRNILMFTIGLGMTIAGARLMVIYGEKIAVSLGVPSIVIGVTMTALGTSLPELMTAITAIRKKASAISVGNIFGANILNLTLVLGGASVIKPVITDGRIISFHLPIILFITLIATASTVIFKKKYPRYIGVALLASYLSYMTATAFLA
ncbi:MAG: calcium/sodium antiporter [Clostridia bacterium]